MDDDSRCCGSGTCLINAEGFCWCGQRWDGAQMCPPQAGADRQVSGDSAPAPETPNRPN